MSAHAPLLVDAVSEGVLESAPVGIAACDRELRWVAWNAAMEALTGLPAAEVLGEPVTHVGAALAGESPAVILRAVLDGTTVDVGDAEPGRGGAGRGRWGGRECEEMSSTSFERRRLQVARSHAPTTT